MSWCLWDFAIFLLDLSCLATCITYLPTYDGELPRPASPFTLPFFLDTARSTTASTFLSATTGASAVLLLLCVKRHMNGYTALQHDFDRVLRDIDSDDF